jgi:hypothetical protein
MDGAEPDTKIFLLSPASTAGIRAAQLTSLRSGFHTARRFRSSEGVPIAEAFTFMSALYFRGKIAYSRHFAAPPEGFSGDGILVIAPGFGLVPPDWALTVERMGKLKRTPVDLKSRSYVTPMRAHARELAAHLPPATRVVLLGSIATGKYVDLLLPVFGDRLVFPRSFVGAGDMKRGGLMLKAVREDRELDYSTLDVPRRGSRS